MTVNVGKVDCESEDVVRLSIFRPKKKLLGLTLLRSL